MAIKTKQPWALVTLLSGAMHLALLGACFWFFNIPRSVSIVAAGEGQGSGEEMIEVSTVDGRTLGFTSPLTVSYVGDKENTANNADLTTETPKPDPDSEVLSSATPTPTPKDKNTTDRPTANQTSQIVSQTPLTGNSQQTNIQVGSSMGSPVPAMVQGVGVSTAGPGIPGLTGMPGGSEYGRRIQRILSSNYNPTVTDGEPQYVIVDLRIARDGRIISVANGQIAVNYFKRRSSISSVNYAVVRAVIASDPLPPFPNGFLIGAQEAVATVWFKYPK